MKKRYTISGLILALAVVLLTAINCYNYYIGKMIYQESIAHLRESYSQVNQTLELFTQRNWNVLNIWEEDLQDAQTDEDRDQVWNSLKNGKGTWQYSDFYMFNENCDFKTLGGRIGRADHISKLVQELFQKQEPLASTYVASSGVRKIVFMLPMDHAVQVDGIDYTGLAVSYDASVVEDLIVNHLYEGVSDCYVLGTGGELLLSLASVHDPVDSLEELSVFSDTDVRWKHGSGEAVMEQIRGGEAAEGLYVEHGVRHYLVTVPEQSGDWSILGIVEADAVDSGVRQIQTGTIVLLGATSIILMLLISMALEAEKRIKLKGKEEQNRELENMANTDGLTGLFNERYFSEILHIKEGNKSPFVLYYLDLDRFKPINDTYGHDVGDIVLREVAKRLKTCIRDTDYAFRIGGDEFALIASMRYEEKSCEQLQERVCQSILRPIEVDGKTLEVGVSCGCAAYPDDCLEAAGIRILADHRMYAVKAEHHSGR